MLLDRTASNRLRDPARQLPHRSLQEQAELGPEPAQRSMVRSNVGTMARRRSRPLKSRACLRLRVTRAIKPLELYGDEVFAAAVAELDARGLADVNAHRVRREEGAGAAHQERRTCAAPA
jgi:hypothetical protein